MRTRLVKSSSDSRPHLRSLYEDKRGNTSMENTRKPLKRKRQNHGKYELVYGKIYDKRTKVDLELEEKRLQKRDRNVHIVEKFMDRKIVEGKKYLLVKWKLYPDASNTWEEERELIKTCPILVEMFKEELFSKGYSVATWHKIEYKEYCKLYYERLGTANQLPKLPKMKRNTRFDNTGGVMSLK